MADDNDELEDILIYVFKEGYNAALADGSKATYLNEDDSKGVPIVGEALDRLKSHIAALQRQAELAVRIDELESLEHNHRMFGDWEAVIEERLAVLKEETK